MPPRKSDPAGPATQRKSDVSIARFALKEDFENAPQSRDDQPAPEQMEGAATTKAPAASTGTAAETRHDSAEKREKDTYTIEVCCSFVSP